MQRTRAQGLERQVWEATVARIRDRLVQMARNGDDPTDYSTLWEQTGKLPSWHRFGAALQEVGRREHQAKHPPLLALAIRRSDKLPVSVAWECFIDQGTNTSERREIHIAALREVREFWRAHST